MITVKVELPADVLETLKTKSPKRIWDNYAVIGEVQKSDRIKFVVAAAIRDGVRYINIREFYKKQSDGCWKPGRDGITVPLLLPIEKGTKFIKPLDELKSVIDSTAEALAVMELEDDENAVYVWPKEKKQDGEN